MKEGMEFDVLSTKGDDIADPDTGRPLGSIPIVKVRVRVTEVLPRLSVASTFRTTRVNRGGEGMDIQSFTRSLMPPQYELIVETLKEV